LLCGIIGAQTASNHIYSGHVFSEITKAIVDEFHQQWLFVWILTGQALFKPASQPEHNQ